VLVLNQFQLSKGSNMIIWRTVMIFAIAWVYITFNWVVWTHLFWDGETFLPGKEVICEFRIYMSTFDQWSLEENRMFVEKVESRARQDGWKGTIWKRSCARN